MADSFALTLKINGAGVDGWGDVKDDNTFEFKATEAETASGEVVSCNFDGEEMRSLESSEFLFAFDSEQTTDTSKGDTPHLEFMSAKPATMSEADDPGVGEQSQIVPSENPPFDFDLII